MRCVHEIRANGVAPVPVADACLHSQQMTAENCLPPSHTAAYYVLERVYSIFRCSVIPGTSSNRLEAVHQPKNAQGCGGWPPPYRAHRARSLLSSP